MAVPVAARVERKWRENEMLLEKNDSVALAAAGPCDDPGVFSLPSRSARRRLRRSRVKEKFRSFLSREALLAARLPKCIPTDMPEKMPCKERFIIIEIPKLVYPTLVYDDFRFPWDVYGSYPLAPHDQYSLFGTDDINGFMEKDAPPLEHAVTGMPTFMQTSHTRLDPRPPNQRKWTWPKQRRKRGTKEKEQSNATKIMDSDDASPYSCATKAFSAAFKPMAVDHALPSVAASKEFDDYGNLPVKSKETVKAAEEADCWKDVLASLRGQYPRIVEGDWVRLSGLSTSGLNGEVGRVCSATNMPAGRLAVRLESGRHLSIKEENLVKVEMTSEDSDEELSDLPWNDEEDDDDFEDDHV